MNFDKRFPASGRRSGTHPRGTIQPLIQRAQEVAGLAGVLLFALCWSLGPAAPGIGLVLFTLAFLSRLPRLGALLREPVVLWALCLAAYLGLRTALGLGEHRFDREVLTDGFKDWLWLLLFVPFAYWLADNRRRVYWVLGLGLGGFLAGMLGSVNWTHLAAFLGRRTGFHLPVISFSLYCSTALLALLVLAPRLWGLGSGSAGPAQRAARLLLWFLALALLTQGLIQAQSRGTWLAFGLVAPVLLLLRYWRSLTMLESRRLLWVAMAGVLLFATLLAFNSDLIRQRLAAEKDTVAAIVAGGLDSAPKSSISYRLYLWRFAVGKWAQHPLLGWGPGSTETLIAESGREELYQTRNMGYLDHLHNTYLETLLQLGVLGAFLWLGLLAALVQGLWRAHRAGVLPRDMLLWYLGFLVLTAIWSLFDFRLLHYDWRYFWILVAGSGYSYCLHAAGIGPRQGLRDGS
ncbi:MAG: O-antigen ligase family protein [Gammaproteobacteria bacterium]|jgi:O-antigen ligase